MAEFEREVLLNDDRIGDAVDVLVWEAPDDWPPLQRGALVLTGLTQLGPSGYRLLRAGDTLFRTSRSRPAWRGLWQWVGAGGAQSVEDDGLVATP